MREHKIDAGIFEIDLHAVRVNLFQSIKAILRL